MIFLPLPINPMKEGAMPHAQNKFHECNLKERADPSPLSRDRRGLA
jgi:hypothetical protein